MSASYIPSRDADLDTWLANFKTLIAASPTSYGLVSGDGTAITTAYTSWHNAYLAAVNPTTRTTATVATKNAQKALVLTVVRGYAATIRANMAVSDALKIGLGLRIHDTVPTPVPPPATYPMLTLAGMGVGRQELRAADQTTPTKRAKPTGTAGLLLFRAIGTAAASDPSQCAFLAFATRTGFTAEFDPADNGKVATYFARWTNSKGQMGPWGPAASMPVAA
ncbi:MAG: hypothetical protein Q8L55_09905 [Phycisphaerales bacterium]|nr:hypothetical protein [Phycisphaerales bacterium]